MEIAKAPKLILDHIPSIVGFSADENSSSLILFHKLITSLPVPLSDSDVSDFVSDIYKSLFSINLRVILPFISEVKWSSFEDFLIVDLWLASHELPDAFWSNCIRFSSGYSFYIDFIWFLSLDSG